MTRPERPPSSLQLAWRQTARDFRAGELRLLALASPTGSSAASSAARARSAAATR